MSAKTATKKSSQRTYHKNSGTKRAPREGGGVSPATVLVVSFAVSFLLFIAILGFGGPFGEGCRYVIFGVFGVFGYLFPLLLFGCSLLGVLGRGSGIARAKLIFGILAYLLVSMLIELFIHGEEAVGAAAAFAAGHINHSGGGFIGGLISSLCVQFFGLVGSFVLTFAGLIICAVILTEDSKPVVSFRENKDIRKRRAALRRREHRSRRVREEENRRMHEESRRRVQTRSEKFEGISRDTTIVPRVENPVPTVPHVENPAPAASNEASAVPAIPLQAPPAEPVRKGPTDDVREISFSGSALEDLKEEALTEEVLTEPVTSEPYIPLSDPDEPLGSYRNSIDEIKDVSKDVVRTERIVIEPEVEPSPIEAESFIPDITPSQAASIEPFVEPEPEEIPVMAEPEPEEIPVMAEPEPDEIPVMAEPEPEELSVTIEPEHKAEDLSLMAEPEVLEKEYHLPPVDLLKMPVKKTGTSQEELDKTADKLKQTLANFGVNVSIKNAVCGPTVTRYELQPEKGVKVSKILNLQDDIKLNLAAADIRIEAPIPGKPAVGIEVPNREPAVVSFRELMESDEFQNAASPITFAAGRDIGGSIMISDIAKMPHVLIAGATGAGKSVCINTIIMSILYKAMPDEVKFIMIDPKVVELSVYNGIPHLLIPVVTDPKKAAGALQWAVKEMMDRYDRFAKTGVRDMKGYNSLIIDGHISYEMNGQVVEAAAQRMPQIVVIVDELADLMMVASKEVEESICRLAQLARAAGIHLVIATQRPSVNVITGLIKANMPSRIAFAVTSGVDSRTILDMVGAEKLLGKGDMLYYPQGLPKPLRVQGAFVSDQEVARVVDFIRKQCGPVVYDDNIDIQMKEAEKTVQVEQGSVLDRGDERDAYFDEAVNILSGKKKASISMLQRYLKIGFNRAARIMDQLEEAGIVGPDEGTMGRKVLTADTQGSGQGADNHTESDEDTGDNLNNIYENASEEYHNEDGY